MRFPSGNLIFDLSKNCQAKSQGWSLPARFRDTSTARVRDFFNVQLSQYDFPKILQPSRFGFLSPKIKGLGRKNFTKIVKPPNVLGDLDENDLSNLRDLLKIDYNWSPMNDQSFWKYFALVVAVLLLVGIIIAMFVIHRTCRRKETLEVQAPAADRAAQRFLSIEDTVMT